MATHNQEIVNAMRRRVSLEAGTSFATSRRRPTSGSTDRWASPLHGLQRGACLAGVLAQRDDEPRRHRDRHPARPPGGAPHRHRRPELGLAFIEDKVAVTARLRDEISETRLIGSSPTSRPPGAESVDYAPVVAMARLRASYQELGRELDLGSEDSDITLFASLEISLTDPDASSDVSAALAEHPSVERASRPSRPSTTRCSASSMSFAPWASSGSGWWASPSCS